MTGVKKKKKKDIEREKLIKWEYISFQHSKMIYEINGRNEIWKVISVHL